MKTVLLLSLLLLISASSQAALNCSALMYNLIQADLRSGTSTYYFQNLEELLNSFSKGLIPDLNEPTQKEAFELYLDIKYGRTDTITEQHLNEIRETLLQYPDLSKQPLRNMRVETFHKDYPKFDELDQFISSQIKTSSNIRASLFQVEANATYWKQLLGYERPDEISLKNLAGVDKKTLKKKAKEHWNNFIDMYLPLELRERLVDRTVLPQIRGKELFEILNNLRLRAIEKGKESRHFSQAIIDLIHTIGFHDEYIQHTLKGSDGLKVIEAYETVLSERDLFVTELGIGKTFNDALAYFGIDTPTGLPEKMNLKKQVESLREKVMDSSVVAESRRSRKTVRHLSLVESPLRGCLGNDCSTRTYLSKAFDPNYHYYTITDNEGFSKGQISIVLGHAQREEKRVEVAYIDKIQNVSYSEIALLIEGVRRSVAEAGYTLALPKNMGNHNGISNVEQIGDFIRKNINVDEMPLTEFHPTPNQYNFENVHSRVEKVTDWFAVKEITFEDDVLIVPGEINYPWKIESIDNMRELVESIDALKNGNLDDRIKYLTAAEGLNQTEFAFGNYEEIVKQWLQEQNTPFRLKKEIVIHKLANKEGRLSDYLGYFDSSQKIDLIQNFLETPRYRSYALEFGSIEHCIVAVRKSRSVYHDLVEKIAPNDHAFVMKLLSEEDISDKLLAKILSDVKWNLESQTIEGYSRITSLLKGNHQYDYYSDYLIKKYVKKIDDEIALGRKVLEDLSSGNVEVISLTMKLINERSRLHLEEYSTLEIV